MVACRKYSNQTALESSQCSFQDGEGMESGSPNYPFEAALRFCRKCSRQFLLRFGQDIHRKMMGTTKNLNNGSVMIDAEEN